jgi:Sulfotransferase family
VKGDPRESVLIREPIVILAAPRSGSSLLLAVLSAHPDLWSLYKESNRILEGPFHPRFRGWASNVLTEDDLDAGSRAWLPRRLFDDAGNLERLPLARFVPLRGRGRPWYSAGIAMASRPLKRPPIRFVEKSPKNTLRIPFLRALFPDARFIHLTRDPAANIASLFRGWRDPHRHNVYPLPDGFHLSGYKGTHWCFVLQPGWRSFDGASLIDVCADQWRACNEHCLRDLRAVAADRVLRMRFEDLVAEPSTRLSEIARWADLDPKPFARFARGLPVIQPSARSHGGTDHRLPPEVDPAVSRLRRLSAELGYG